MQKKFVWIEDDFQIMMPLMEPLKERGHDLIVLRTEKEALENIDILRKSDLIFVDLIIPHGDKKVDPFRQAPNTEAGMQLVSTLLKTEKITTPIVVLSIVSSSEIHKKLYQLGVRNIIVKPALISEINETITNILGTNW